MFGTEDGAPAGRGPVLDARSLSRTLLALTTLVTVGCFGDKQPATPGGDDPEPQEREARILLTNTGDGAGGVEATFAAGTVTHDCPEYLEPDQSCTYEATHTANIGSATLTPDPDGFSEFVEYDSQACGTDPDCTISFGEDSQTVDVDVVFDLTVGYVDFTPDPVAVAVGADATVTASAYADPPRERPVVEAEFEWATSDPAVAAVDLTSAGTTTVTGVAAGEAWIRATARGKTDSVQVVVGG